MQPIELRPYRHDVHTDDVFRHAEWVDERGRACAIDQYGRCAARLTVDQEHSWGHMSAVARDEHESREQHRERIRAETARLLGELFDKLRPGPDRLFELHQLVTKTWGLKRSHASCTLETVLRGAPHAGGHGHRRRSVIGGGWYDHGSTYKLGRGFALAVGHPYARGFGGVCAEREHLDGIIYWAGPDGVSWYYPGSTIVVMAFAPRAHPEFTRDLRRLFGEFGQFEE